MTAPGPVYWADERLREWAAWSRGSSARGYDSSVPFMREVNQSQGGSLYMAPRIEVTEKAVAQVLSSSFKADKPKARIIRHFYLGGKTLPEVASALSWSQDYTEMMLWAAQSTVGRFISHIEYELDRVKKTPKMSRIMGGGVRPKET